MYGGLTRVSTLKEKHISYLFAWLQELSVTDLDKILHDDFPVEAFPFQVVVAKSAEPECVSLFILSNKLGEGFNATVYHVCDQFNFNYSTKIADHCVFSHPICAKVHRKREKKDPKESAEQLEERLKRRHQMFVNEIEFTRMMNDGDAFMLRQFFQTDGTTDDLAIFIMREFSGDNLRVVCEDIFLEKKPPLSFQTCLNISALITEQLVVLHSHGIFHRDLRIDNVLCELDPLMQRVKSLFLIDFGLSARSGDAPALYGGYQMAPEELSETDTVHLTEKVDIFSLGFSFAVLLFALIPGRHFFNIVRAEMEKLDDSWEYKLKHTMEFRTKEGYHQLLDIKIKMVEVILTNIERIAAIPFEVRESLTRLITTMMAIEPEARPNAKDVLIHLTQITRRTEKTDSRHPRWSPIMFARSLEAEGFPHPRDRFSFSPI